MRRLTREGVGRVAAWSGATALVAGGLVLVPAAPASADVAECLVADEDTADADPAEGPSEPLEAMQVPQAHEVLRQSGVAPAGEGIGVAVVDSGIKATDGLTVVESIPSGQDVLTDVPYYQGTIVAGLIAGEARGDGGGGGDGADATDDRPIGVAPGVDLYDVRVYDATAEETSTTEDITTPGPDQVLAGLQAVLGRVRSGDVAGDPIKIVNVSMQVPQDDRIDQAVSDLRDEGVLVVASSGDRPQDEDNAGSYADYYHGGPPPPGEDAAPDVAPANARGAVGVSAVGGLGSDLSELVLRNSSTDLTAPSGQAVSFGLHGLSCVVVDPGARWATAEVSGVVALVWSYLGANTPADKVLEVVERTAAGNGARNPTTGLGVVQPLEAVTSALVDGGRPPEIATDVAGDQPASAPEPEEDPLASTRRNAVWWGLVGGAALVVALILRPLLARRRD